MRLGVLGSKESWYLRDLVRAAGDRHQIVPVTFRDLMSTVGAGAIDVASQGIDLARLDALLVRTMPPGSLEQVVFRMDALHQLEARGVPVFNPPRSLETAVDKYLATAKLQAAGLMVPETIVCQGEEEAMEAFVKLGGDVVCKPLFGSEGRGIARLSDEALALRAVKMLAQLGAVIYLQRFIEHEGYDIRLFVLGEEVFGIERHNPLDFRTNVSRGATTRCFQVSDKNRSLARRAADALGVPMAGVDFLPARDGTLYAIEVNAVPGWKALARTLQIDVAQRVLNFVEMRIR